MRTIYKIAKTELQVLFYSPIAWMIIIIFTFQASMIFSVLFEGTIKFHSMVDHGTYNLTAMTFADKKGLFMQILFSLYLYIPLLTMGLMSREYSSGSIKLLYNSPITNTQIILGKYLSMMVYALVLIAILSVFVVFAGITIPHFDWGLCFSGLLGIYLLICVYSAIGLFMSSITSYQLVAALCTLSLLAVLSYMREVWQNIEFVRELTYWLSISGRANQFIHGLICSEDLLYFLILIALFLCLTIIQLQAARQKSRWTVTWSKFFMLFAGVMFLGYLTSRPKLMFFYDATQTKAMSLVPKTQELISKLKGGMTITTYGNIMENDFGYVASRSVKEDIAGELMPYIRFKPETDTKYVYYYPKDTETRDLYYMVDLLDENINKVLRSDKVDIPIDSVAEGISIVRIFERENGQKEILPVYNDATKFPKEEDYFTMFRRFVETPHPVGYLTGHGERNMLKSADRDYRLIMRERSFRQSFINNGFDVVELTLEQKVPSDVNLLIIADPRGQLTDLEKGNLQEYIDRGGNLFMALNPQSSQSFKEFIEQFGVDVVPGSLVRPNSRTTADIVYSISIPNSADKMGGIFGDLLREETLMAGARCCGFNYPANKGYDVTPLFTTAGKGVWNEVETTNFADDTVRLNPVAGEVEKAYVTGLGVSRKVDDRVQKIMLFGNADYFSNTGLDFKAEEGVLNLDVMGASVYWLSDGYSPVQIVRPVPPDEYINITRKNSKWISIFFLGIYPGILLLIALGLWLMRRGK
ncbi:Gldg family protein [Butyricimonas hominis]|uniref:Gldg family protein n=1 Tax=Butyricimonas TaxID=574697 RepID=UPI003518A368